MRPMVNFFGDESTKRSSSILGKTMNPYVKVAVMPFQSLARTRAIRRVREHSLAHFEAVHNPTMRLELPPLGSGEPVDNDATTGGEAFSSERKILECDNQGNAGASSENDKSPPEGTTDHLSESNRKNSLLAMFSKDKLSRSPNGSPEINGTPKSPRRRKSGPEQLAVPAPRAGETTSPDVESKSGDEADNPKKRFTQKSFRRSMHESDTSLRRGSYGSQDDNDMTRKRRRRSRISSEDVRPGVALFRERTEDTVAYLRFEVFDEDRFGDDRPLGSCRLQLAYFLRHPNLTYREELEVRTGDNVSGVVTATIRFEPNPEPVPIYSESAPEGHVMEGHVPNSSQPPESCPTHTNMSVASPHGSVASMSTSASPFPLMGVPRAPRTPHPTPDETHFVGKLGGIGEETPMPRNLPAMSVRPTADLNMPESAQKPPGPLGIISTPDSVLPGRPLLNSPFLTSSSPQDSTSGKTGENTSLAAGVPVNGTTESPESNDGDFVVEKKGRPSPLTEVTALGESPVASPRSFSNVAPKKSFGGRSGSVSTSRIFRPTITTDGLTPPATPESSFSLSPSQSPTFPDDATSPSFKRRKGKMRPRHTLIAGQIPTFAAPSDPTAPVSDTTIKEAIRRVEEVASGKTLHPQGKHKTGGGGIPATMPVFRRESAIFSADTLGWGRISQAAKSAWESLTSSFAGRGDDDRISEISEEDDDPKHTPVYEHGGTFIIHVLHVSELQREGSGIVPRSIGSYDARTLFSCILVVMAYLFGGVFAFMKLEDFRFVDALYFTLVTLTTVGYGDIVPTSKNGKIFTSLYAMSGIMLIGIALGVLAAFLLDQQERRMQQFLQKSKGAKDDMSEGDTWTMSESPQLTARKKSISLFAFLLVITVFGTCMMMVLEDLNLIDAMYFAVATVTTVGFGDIKPKTDEGKYFACAFVLMGVLSAGKVLGGLADLALQRQQKKIAEKILRQDLGEDLLEEMAADGSGKVTAAEFLGYMLVKLGKVERSDVDRIQRQFEYLDKDGSGVLTMEDLLCIGETRRGKSHSLLDHPHFGHPLPRSAFRRR
eukprot:Rmarinus@m.4872